MFESKKRGIVARDHATYPPFFTQRFYGMVGGNLGKDIGSFRIDKPCLERFLRSIENRRVDGKLLF